MNLVTLLIVVLIIAFVLGLPQVGGNYGFHSWGYAPSSLLGVVLVIILVLFLIGRL
jgi:hypothetical protein